MKPATASEVSASLQVKVLFWPLPSDSRLEMSKNAIALQPHRPWYSILYIQVLIAIAIGILIGHFYPNTGKALKSLGTYAGGLL